MEKLEKYLTMLKELLIDYSPRILYAIVLLIVGLFVISLLVKGSKKIMHKSKLEDTLIKFLSNLIGWTLKILLFVTIIAKLGVATTSFAAIIGAAGLAIGLALQGSLSNFAGGALIMMFKPFKIGDLIEAQGELGAVKEIEIFTTKIVGLSNKEIIIPNGALSNGNIINYTSLGTRRVDLIIGVSYDSDIKETKEVLMSVLNSNDKILNDPEPSVNVHALADSSVNFAVRPWCKPEDYWDVYFGVTEQTKLALDKAGIEIPYPHQVEIHKQG